MSENSHSSNTGLALLVIRSDDMDKAAAFYTALGLAFVKHSHPPCGEHYSSVGGACVFEICQRKNNQRSMARGREMMTDWVVEALQQLGGRGSILDISRRVW